MTAASAGPPAEIDRAAVAKYWEGAIMTLGLEAGSLPDDTFQFGDSAEMADRLLALVVGGPKRATASCRLDDAEDGSNLPAVGDLAVVCTGSGLPAAVIRTTDVRVGPLASVDERFAWDEGEGDRTRADWMRMHANYFERAHPTAWRAFGHDLPVVFERFEVVCREPETPR
jgi:uncharacterized protein YhfF